MATFTVTATAAGSTSFGIGMFVAVVTGAAVTQNGATVGVTNTTPNDAITPNASSSWVYGSILGLAGTVTPTAATTVKQDGHSIGGLELVSCRTTGTTTISTPVTVGVTSTQNGISLVLVEILNASGLAEDASTPAGVTTALASTITTASFTPPSSSLLVAMVQSNGAGGVATMGITDTSGLGLTWVEQKKQNTAGDGYAGIWTAQIAGGTNANAGLPASTGAGNAAVAGVSLGMTIQGH